MSNYENAPATLLLATHCAACSRPLVDAVSVEAGMGPDCRKKYMKAETSPENREEANKLVHQIAAALSQSVISGSKLAASLIPQVRALGFEKLADKLTKEFVSVSITAEGGKLIVRMPYDERAVSLCQRIPGRIWRKESKVTEFPATQARAVWAMLQACYKGQRAIGPKGYFEIA